MTDSLKLRVFSGWSILVLGALLFIFSFAPAILRGGNSPVAGMIAVVGLLAIATGIASFVGNATTLTERGARGLSAVLESLILAAVGGAIGIRVQRDSFFASLGTFSTILVIVFVALFCFAALARISLLRQSSLGALPTSLVIVFVAIARQSWAAVRQSWTAFLTHNDGTRAGLRWLNGIFLVLYGVGLGANIFDGFSSSKPTGSVPMIGFVLLGSALAAPCLFGFLAALNPKNEKRRKLAKWSNLLVLGMVVLIFLPSAIKSGTTPGATGDVRSRMLYGIILGAIIGFPALINLRAFWKQIAIAGPPANPERSAESLQSTNQDFGGQVAEPPKLDLKEVGQSSAQEPSASSEQTEPHTETLQMDVAATTSVNKANYFIRHWRGDLSLGVSYWVNGMLGTFLVLLVSNMLVQMQDSISLKFLAVLSLVVYATAILASVWQLVGVWRSASKHVSRGGSSGWATTARVVVVFGVLESIGIVWGNYIPQSAEMFRILAGDKSIPAYKIRVLPGGTEIEYRGGLRAGSAKDLENILTAVPQAKVLHIESIGGRIIEAKAMSKLIHDRGMTTYTSDYCLSAATLVLMSGKERVIGTGAKVGFHAGSFPGLTGDQMREMNESARTTMQSAGVSESFISRVLSTPSEQMWYPTYEEMRAAGVITSQSPGDRFASSWDVSDVDLAALTKNLSDYPWLRTIKNVEPETYGKMMTNFVTALRSGKSEGEAAGMISEAAGQLMNKYFPAASDEAILALRDQWIAFLTRYKDMNSKGCIAVLTGAKINYKRIFPDLNMTNSLLVVEKVISSGASRIPVPVNKKMAEEDFVIVLKPLTAKYGDDVQLLYKQETWSNNPQKVCDMLLMMYQQEAALPDKRSANLMRYLITDPAVTAPSGVAQAVTDGEQRYMVNKGDTLTTIANQFGITVKALRSANNLSTDKLKVGQPLRIPKEATLSEIKASAERGELNAQIELARR